MQFEQSILDFITDLKANNNREWFNANKKRYEDELVAPALDFIRAIGPQLEQVSPHYRAEAKRTGGSLFRIYRDTRFSKEKTPYKTHVGIQFRHDRAKDVYAPGFYVHIEPEIVYVGVGSWHPPADAIKAIRTRIDREPKAWLAARNDETFRRVFGELGGESLKRPPKGFDKAHPMIEDLKRKDFIASRELGTEALLSAGFVDEVGSSFAAAAPFLRFLAESVGQPF